MKSNKPDNNMLKRIRDCILFTDLTPIQFNSIIDHSTVTRLNESDSLFKQHSEARHFFYLDSGQITLTRLSPDGNEKVIDIIKPGQTFAEAVVFAGRQGYPVNAQALVDSVVLCIDSLYYKDFIHNCPEACFALMARMSQRLHWQVNEIDRLTLHTASFRLATFLLDHLPGSAEGEQTIKLTTPKHVIASRLTIKPETFSRTLKRMVDAGLLSVSDSQIKVYDVKKLKQHIHIDEV